MRLITWFKAQRWLHVAVLAGPLPRERVAKRAPARYQPSFTLGGQATSHIDTSVSDDEGYGCEQESSSSEQ